MLHTQTIRARNQSKTSRFKFFKLHQQFILEIVGIILINIKK